ncbi:13761_t:CDS:2, partial [Racocetra persica]
MHPEHNHQLISENASFATSYRKLTTDMKKLIESYTICDIDVLSQVWLLRGLFSDATIVDYDVKNYVYKQTIEATGVQPGAFMIDTDPGLESHIGRNIEKQLAKLLGDCYADFIKNQLNTYLDSLIHVKQPGQKHLQTVNERTQLHVLFNRIESHVAEEQFAGRFAAWHKKTASYMTPSVPGRLFLNIYNILQKYVMPKILQLHTDQMNEAVMYRSKRVSFEDLYNLTLEAVDNGPIEFEYDFCQIWFDELLEGVDYSLVAKVWDVQSIEYNSHVGQNSEKAYFHISLISRRWYKDEFMDTVVADEPFVRNKLLEKNSSTPSLPSFLDVADSWNTMLIKPPVQTAVKVIGRKQSIKGILLGLAHKYVEVVNYDDLNNLKILIETFKEWICTHEEAQCDKRTIEQELNDDQIAENNQDTE